MSDTVRWVFEEMETGDTHTVELNPNEAGGWLASREITWAAWDSRPSGHVGRAAPVSWQFSGVVRTKTHHDSLIAWQKKPGKVRVTDHLGRTFETMIESLEMLDRRPTGSNSWRFRYTFNCLLLRRIA